MDLRAWIQSGKRPAAASPASPSPSKQAKADASEMNIKTHVSMEKMKELLAMEEFKDQPLTVEGGSIRCRACRADIPSEACRLRQHCFQQQKVAARAEFEKRTEDEKMRLRHYKKTVKLNNKERAGLVLLKVVELTVSAC